MAGHTLRPRKWATDALVTVLGDSDTPPVGMQKKLTSEMGSRLFAGALAALMKKRLTRFGVAASDEELRLSFAAARDGPPEVAMAFLATA